MTHLTLREGGLESGMAPLRSEGLSASPFAFPSAYLSSTVSPYAKPTVR